MPYAIRTIVAGVAELDAADPVLRYAPELAERLGAHLYLVHAYKLLEPMPMGAVALMPEAGAEGAPEEALLDRERELQERLAALVPARGGPPVVTRIRLAPAQTAILEVADETSADLVLVGATRQGRLGRAILGTTAGRTVRHARVPVLVLRGPPRHPGTRVLVTTDLSELSREACRTGIEASAALFGDGIRYRCVLALAAGVGELPVTEQRRVLAADGLREFVATLSADGPEIDEVVRVGAPDEEIVAEAAEWGADLVVLGTHGRSGLSRLFMGSVAEAALRDLGCSALVIPSVTHAAGEG